MMTKWTYIVPAYKQHTRKWYVLRCSYCGADLMSGTRASIMRALRHGSVVPCCSIKAPGVKPSWAA